MFIKLPALFPSPLSSQNDLNKSHSVRRWIQTPPIPIISQYVSENNKNVSDPENNDPLHDTNCPATRSVYSLPPLTADHHLDSDKASHVHLCPHLDTSSYSSQEFQIGHTKIIKPLEKLIQTTKKLFLCNPFDINDLELADSELCLLKEIINKKLVQNKIGKMVMGDNNNDYKEKLLDTINNTITVHSSTKRIEENNKFVYKYTLKYLRHQFYVKEGLKKSLDSEVQFYRFYFESVCKNLKVPIEYFFDPLYKVCNKNPYYKSINNKYLGLIFCSPSFKADFFSFLKNDFKSTYIMIINSKLRKFFKKLRNDITGDRSRKYSSILIDRFAEKLRKNKKCKLPWTIREVNSALVHFHSLIYYY